MATTTTKTRPRFRRPTPSRAGRGEVRFAVALLLPAALVVFGVVLYPAVRTLVVSLFDVTSAMPGSYPFVGLRNYTKVFGDPSFYTVLWHTAYFTLVSTALELTLGIGVAMVLNAPLKARWLWRSLVVLPWALPTIVDGALWRWIYNGQYGALNGLLSALHITDANHQWLGSPFLALNMVIIADVWKNTSVVAFFVLAGLQTIPHDLYEAARMDGAGPVRSFLRVTLPLLRPSIAVVLILRTIEAFKVFDIIYVMTGGGPASGTQTVAFYTYQQAFSNQLFGYGSALAYLIALAVFALAMMYLRILRQGAMAGVK
ncbi:carbohydrate ABC transporter permease [Actinomadura sp. HBU206391]|uniref:carbohydrate ABC transporter permease n=1 Tax=Actinomadura sp. HBU206391 TaxID=2731692 RepID=UPI00164FE6F5|nr:sugar ABC transporter permease [Actinomadura sp. HBU206391]MBC6458361.1 sugar ABC transporter permease [Actinomadura sp. HBU206391]